MLQPISVQTGKIQNFPAVRQTSTNFDLELFLRAGWVFFLDARRILLGWGNGTWVEHPSHDDLCALYAPDFYLEASKPWWVSPNWLVCHPRHLLEQLQGKVGVHECANEQCWVEPDSNAFASTFLQIKDELQKNRVQKVVPVVMASAVAPPTTFSLAQALINILRQQESHLRPYGWWTETEGMIGLTPELLFSKTPSTLRTMALAGTRRGTLTDAEGALFLNDPKESHEHGLVVDDLKNVLGRWGEVTVDSTSVVRFPNLAHLQTNLEVALSHPLSFTDAVAALHPTPALGVAPRELGLEWLRQWEGPHKRERFGAPFGVSVQLGRETGCEIEECLVAIRNIQWQDTISQDAEVSSIVRQFFLGSGCGVVAESELQNEWQELTAKRASVRHLMQV